MFYYNYYKSLAKTYVKAFFQKENAKQANINFLDIGIINPSIGTANLGDLIIYDAVINELRSHYPNDLFTNYPSQLHTNYEAKQMMGKKDFLFVSGTNLLTSNMNERFQWKIDPSHKIFLKNKVLLMGVGWWQYQIKPNSYTRRLYKSILKSEYLHSVRDSYTYNMLQDIGITNVINTSCPTLWGLKPDLCASIPKKKASNVITTLTFYKSDTQLDRKMLEILIEKYETVYLWVQGIEDIGYLNKIYARADKIKLVAPTIEAYNKILEEPSIEYLGTRLHAGIRALQKGVRTLIVAVDNRAVEIGKDTNLNVIKREDIEQMHDFIDLPYQTKINLPQENIDRWRASLPKSILNK
ncbi:polysaccharide pyruvyl transferase family protein [Flavobacterium luteum]|uniref:Polysaccharide pyruvyl transferase family protein n=1 Tax=Flavobacterium luteum TaxID=2026654 RepID=A0A7J5AE63_9FLAO|nr:polysaccharide pyruvyl transferase family protein [Flavobacterium luteum]KAB1155783.1 polysaccharide pyruvyl transferase family protein [Flavobacterium luteum]